jgi:glycerol kinase
VSSPLILAIDQGTSSTKCLLVDEAGRVVKQGQASLGQSMPKPGWVEQDADEIWNSVRRAVAATVPPEIARRVFAIGLSTQRESCVVWDRRSGRALTPVLSWQDQRTEALCETLRKRGQSDVVRRKSGLPLDAMFSAAKAQWLLDEIDPDRVRARAGDLCVGTIDSFILSRFGGEAIVEAGNASRMQFVDVVEAQFDDELCAIFETPRAALPHIVRSVGPFPAALGLAPLPDGVPIHAVMADSHAALFAHGAFAPGPVKATHGTGSSVMGLIDQRRLAEGATLHPGLCLTLAWRIDAPVLAFEGNIRASGSTLVWAADLLGIDVDELARLAASVEDAQGVHLVPAFNGLGAPWWDGAAVAALSGFTLGAGRPHVARAAFESIAFQIADVIQAVRVGGPPIERLLVDGGPTRNDGLMQIEADLVGVEVVRAEAAELSALGAAHLAGLGAGLFSIDDLRKLDRPGAVFHPAMSEDRRRSRQGAWRHTLARSRSGAGLSDSG